MEVLRAKKFKATIHNIYGRGPEEVEDFYIYSNKRTIVMPPANSLLYPFKNNPIRWYTKSNGYYFAMKVDYASGGYYDKLKSYSVRQTLTDRYYEIMKKCIEGDIAIGEDKKREGMERNGLRYYFNDTIDDQIFEGFEFGNTIHSQDGVDLRKFHESLEESFNTYHNDTYDAKIFKRKPNPKNCTQALRGQGLLVVGASIMNGYYMPGMYDYIEKGL